MILYDPALAMNFHDYGIMLPIVPDRGKQILSFLSKNYYPGARGATMPYPGPVFSAADALSFLNFDKSGVITREDLERIHSGEFIASLYGDRENSLEAALLATYELIDAQGRPHRYEPERATKPLAGLFRIILAHVGGAYLACRLALSEGPGFCYYMGGGMHHARYDAGSGFCLINDAAIAVTKIFSENTYNKTHNGCQERPVRLIWIIDMDAHKGDGTAELFRFARQRGELRNPSGLRELQASADGKAEEKAGEKPCVLTLSIHMAKGWPLDAESLAAAKEGRAPLVPSDIDIGIDAGEEETYTPRLAEGIKELERISAVLFRDGKPDLVLVVDGADPYEHDGLPSSSLLKLTLEQCVERDIYVYRYVTGRGIPSAWIQAGGYGGRAWEPPAYFLQEIR